MGRYDDPGKSVFNGHHHRIKRSETFHGLGAARDRASFDNEPATGCGALFLLMILGIAGAVMGAVFGG